MQQTHVWECLELTFHAKQAYANPFRDVALRVDLYGPEGQHYVIPGFWDGGDVWKARVTPTAPGTWTWTSLCSALSDDGLAGHVGQFVAAPWSPAEIDASPMRRGFVLIPEGARHFAHADGTPFYWLGDTFWAGCMGRVSDDEYTQYLADRRAKGFTVSQMVMARPTGDVAVPAKGSYWAGSDGDLVNAGGAPYTRKYDLINPAYFQVVDRRVREMLEAGIIPCLLGLWGQDLTTVGEQTVTEMWRYMIARYAAYNVIWCVTGEYMFGPDVEAWRRIGREIDAVDPYAHPTTVHSIAPHSASRHYQADLWYDFNFVQVGHCYSLRQFMETLPFIDYHLTPVKPSIMSESWYENHATCLGEDAPRFGEAEIRFVSYVPLLQGCIGQSYGAHGIWCWAGEQDEASPNHNNPSRWQHDLALPGSRQMAHLRAVMESVTWTALRPSPEVVSTMAPGAAYCASVPGEEYVVYAYDCTYKLMLFLPPLVENPDPADYPGRWFNPRTGAWHDAEATGQWYGNYLLWSVTPPDAQDWVLVVKRRGIRCGW